MSCFVTPTDASTSSAASIKRSSRLAIEVLPERGARHADNGDAVLDAIRAHDASFDPIGRAFQK